MRVKKTMAATRSAMMRLRMNFISSWSLCAILASLRKAIKHGAFAKCSAESARRLRPMRGLTIACGRVAWWHQGNRSDVCEHGGR